MLGNSALNSNEQKTQYLNKYCMFRQSPIWFHHRHYYGHLWTQHSMTVQLAFILISFAFNVAKKHHDFAVVQ